MQLRHSVVALFCIVVALPSVACAASDCEPNPLFSPFPGEHPGKCERSNFAEIKLTAWNSPGNPGVGSDTFSVGGEYWHFINDIDRDGAGHYPAKREVQRNFENAVRAAQGTIHYLDEDTGRVTFSLKRADGTFWGESGCGGGAGLECNKIMHKLVRVPNPVQVIAAPQAAPAAVAEVPLPSGMVDERDSDESGDPRGLPRMRDYVIGDISKHTVYDNHDKPLMRVEEREYKLDRYAKRPPATPETILQHYRKTMELFSGVIDSQSSDKLTGKFLRGGSPVQVTVQIKDGGRRYELTTGGLGAQDGATAIVANAPASAHDAHHSPHPVPPPVISTPAPTLPDRTVASSGFHMPSAPTVWPMRATRGMAVLLVGPGVNRAKAVRFDTTDAEILARENARLRVRVPVLPAGNVRVTLIQENGNETVNGMFQILDAPPADAAVVTIAPCDSQPDRLAGVSEVQPQTVRPGQLLKLTGRRVDDATHVTFTVARHEVDPANTGVNPDLVGIDFGASGKARSAPRWLDTLAENIGRSYGARASIPGECDPHNLSGYAAAKHTGDREITVCVPALALSGPVGLWSASGKSGDVCESTDFSVRVLRSPGAMR